MKKIIGALLILSLSTSNSMAAPKWSTTLAEDVKMLGDLAYGAKVSEVKGNGAESILKNFVAQYTGDEEDLVFKEIGDMADGDEVSEGLTSLQSARRMEEFAEAHTEEQMQNLDEKEDAQKLLLLKAKIYDLKTKWPSLIERLAKKGAKFGYTGWGPGYCGIAFIEMLVIDEREQKVFEVYLSEGGDC